MTAQTVSTKDSRETVVLTVDATLELATSELLTIITNVDIEMVQGVDPGANNVISDSLILAADLVTPDGTIAAGKGVQAVATAGIAGMTYLIAFTCTTNNPDKTLVLKLILPVLDN